MSTHTPFVGDYYDILGVPKDATADEIKKAFRKLAKECHPDVAGDDPAAAQRFNQVRKAYEILVDPISRARYDRAGERRSYRRSSWRPPGGFNFEGPGRPSPGRGQNPWKKGANKLDLEDIFGDFGGMNDFGFGDKPDAGGAPLREKTEGAVRFQGSRVSVGGTPPEPSTPVPGRDISLQVDVEHSVAQAGGTVTLHYPRLRRGDDGLNIYRYSELYDLRLAPGTEHGATLRVDRMGDAGVNGGPYGDLVCDIRVVADRRRPVSADRATNEPAPGTTAGQPPNAPGARHRQARARARSGTDGAGERPAPTPAEPSADAASNGGALPVAISLVEALLGGRVEVPTPTGRVRITVPPGTSSGAKLRLRGRGGGGSDLYVELRIVVPRTLDDESRALIERFAELNPGDPRDEPAS